MRFLLACLHSHLTHHPTHYFTASRWYFTFQCQYCLEKVWRHCLFDLPSLFPNPFIPDRHRMWNSSSVSLKTALVWERGDDIGEGMDAWTILEPALKLPGIQPPLLIQLVAQTLSLIKPARISVSRKGHSDVIASQSLLRVTEITSQVPFNSILLI